MGSTRDRILGFFLSWSGDRGNVDVLTHSFPTRRSSDLQNVFQLCLGTPCTPPLFLSLLLCHLMQTAFPFPPHCNYKALLFCHGAGWEGSLM